MSETLQDRRKPDPQIEFLTSILQSVQGLHAKIADLEDLRYSIGTLTNTVEDHIADENSICKAAFPSGDPDGHRRYHEALLKKAENEAELVMEAKKKLVGLGIPAIIFAIAVVLVFYWNGHMPEAAHISMPKGN